MTEAGERKPSVTVEFAGPDSAQMTVRAEGVSHGQLYAAAWLLDQVAREYRQGELLAKAQEAAQVRLLAAGIRNGGKT